MLDLYKRGLKAFFKLKSVLGDIAPNVNTCLHIFEHTVNLFYFMDVKSGQYVSLRQLQ